MTQRGRPRGFDRNTALQSMMEVFWTRGYEGAQLVDLTAAAGIAPQAFMQLLALRRKHFVRRWITILRRSEQDRCRN